MKDPNTLGKRKSFALTTLQSQWMELNGCDSIAKKILDLLKCSKLYKETGESVQRREDGYGREE